MTFHCRAGLAGLVALTICSLGAAAANARTLAVIKERGSIMLCAHPNALPFSRKAGEPHGFQIDLAELLAKRLGVGLDIGWVVFPFHASRIDCDIILDAIVDPEVQSERRVKLSHPYHQSGVTIVYRTGSTPARTFADLTAKQRIGAIVGSVARLYLGQRDVPTIPFTFEDDLIEGLVAGELDYALVSPNSVGFYNFQHPNAKLEVSPAYRQTPELRWTVAVGMRKADDALVAGINTALDSLLADGTVQRIYARYGIEHQNP